MAAGRLDGKVAFVTGGGTGIGAATALMFGDEGAQVVVSDLDEVAAKQVVGLINEKGGSAIAVQADVTSEPALRAAIELAAGHFGALHIVHNNAGGSTLKDDTVENVALEEMRRTIDVNLIGAFLCARLAVPHLRASGGGAIINMASFLALTALPGRDAYTAAKGAIVSLTRSMAVEFAKDAIRVNAIAPGMILTDRVKQFASDNPAHRDLAELHLLGMGYPEDVAQLATFLASDAARILTGTTIPLDSGLSAQCGVQWT